MTASKASTPHSTSLLDAALAYAARGWPVFPLHHSTGGKCSCGCADLECKTRGKHPRIVGWQEKASTNEQQIREWWRKWPRANIGMPTTARVVIDEDPRNGGDAGDLNLPNTLTAFTPHGGRHFHYAHPGNGAHIGNDNRGKLGAGIDCKAEGGYVLLPPSVIDGTPYCWEDEAQPVADLPGRILLMLQKPAVSVEPMATRKPAMTTGMNEDDRDAHWLAWALAQTREGDSDRVGFLLAQQLLLDRNVRDEGAVLRTYAQRATFDPAHPFNEGDIERWLSSASSSEMVARGEPARSQTARPLRPVRERPKLREVPPPAKEPETIPDPIPLRPPTSDEAPAERRSYHRTEMGNAERLLDAYHERIAYTKAAGYMAWDGKRWQAGAELVVEQWAKIVIRAMYQEAAALAGDAAQEADETARQMAAGEAQELMKWAVSSEKAKMVSAMLMLARSACAVDINHFDKEPWLLNCQNGTVDLHTGILHPHTRTEFLTQITPVVYNPDAQCPRFEQFVHEIMRTASGEDDVEMVHYLQKVLGYALTGDVSPQEWYLLVGEGENGKSTLMEIVAAILGDYAHMMAPESITVTGQTRKGQDASPDIAMLKARRFVRVTETPEGARIDASRIKSLSGSDEQTARFLHRDLFTFRPVAKMFIYTNHRPETRETTHAFWRRVRYIPFDLNLKDHPERKDEKLPEKLRAELPGILAWMVRGCLRWQREGLKPPKRVLEATEAYRADSDVLRDFIESRCVVHAGFEVRAAQLYKAYGEWCKDAGEHQQNMRRFGKAITERGFERKTSNGVVYVGLGLRGEIEQGTLD